MERDKPAAAASFGAATGSGTPGKYRSKDGSGDLCGRQKGRDGSPLSPGPPETARGEKKVNGTATLAGLARDALRRPSTRASFNWHAGLKA